MVFNLFLQALTLIISGLKLECRTKNVNLDYNSHNLVKTEEDS